MEQKHFFLKLDRIKNIKTIIFRNCLDGNINVQALNKIKKMVVVSILQEKELLRFSRGVNFPTETSEKLSSMERETDKNSWE